VSDGREAARLREADALLAEAREAGLAVTMMLPYECHGSTCYTIGLWAPDGSLWAEGSHETAEDVRRHIAVYVDPVGGAGE
jgi:hypothetical protein